MIARSTVGVMKESRHYSAGGQLYYSSFLPVPQKGL
jgi:hypothetical protein